ncbi:hypothetical protein [Burkholderia glumae]|uniref:hypothetical protein n=1 Tax=Burkholderia glumae TaxID=337 RepID=UPI0020370086|nr:hypothetical protein [Burkholderia glumae]MCM2537993.1 hypothetical protein [Burkholderia glumae]
MTQKVTVRTQQSGTAEASNAGADLPENVVVDSLGRRLKIEEPDFLTESRIMRAIGDASSNQHYVLAYVMPAVMVVEIDGVSIARPSTNQQIEAAISRVGREGMMAVLGYIEAKAKEASEVADSAAALKNS